MLPELATWDSGEIKSETQVEGQNNLGFSKLAETLRSKIMYSKNSFRRLKEQLLYLIPHWRTAREHGIRITAESNLVLWRTARGDLQWGIWMEKKALDQQEDSRRTWREQRSAKNRTIVENRSAEESPECARALKTLERVKREPFQSWVFKAREALEHQNVTDQSSNPKP